jgi:diguanylate cyclase (GGDEF)-like protein
MVSAAPDPALPARVSPASSTFAALPPIAEIAALLGPSRTPHWVLDLQENRILWANDSALRLWQAPDLATLAARDLNADMSTSVQQRLAQYATALQHGRVQDEPWTIYPRGIPRPLLCRFRGCRTADDRIALFVEAHAVESDDRDLITAAQALMYTTSMVSTYAPDGTCTYANLAALKSFPGQQQADLTRFLGPTIRAALSGPVDERLEGTYLSEVMTSRGVRIHEVSIRLGQDPVAGGQAFVLTETDVTGQENAKRDLESLASRDPLTGLRNRAYLAAAATWHLASHAAHGRASALMLLDIDRFKMINDTLGHAAGDRLLQVIAERLTAVLPPGTPLSRLGGDEFCCLLTHDGERGLLRQIAALLRSLGRPLKVEGHDLSISGSIGLALTEGNETPFDELLRQADLAMFEAKGNGGNEAMIFRPAMAERSERFLRIEGQLAEAMRRRKLELFYQPRLSLRTGKIVSAEALIRIRSEGAPAAMPSDFIPVAEATGRIAAIGRWALRQAADHLVELRQIGARIDLSVNVSPKQFADPAFLRSLRAVRKILAPLGGGIELEITESMLVDQDRRLQKLMRQIAEMGYTFAIDDFGTAYSNLAGLSRYPIHCIKIDRTLVAHRDFRALVGAVLTIARSYGAKVVAEGVETEEQRLWLQESLCDEFQGYLFSRPVPFAELQRLIAAGY